MILGAARALLRGALIASIAAAASSLAATPQIAIGEAHVLVLHADGSVWAWGRNELGQLGDGRVLRTTGPPFGPTFASSQVQAFTAGTVSVTFTDANNATLTYTVNGVSGTKNITRQVF